jgi:hypothetical protein
MSGHYVGARERSHNVEDLRELAEIEEHGVVLVVLSLGDDVLACRVKGARGA